MDTLTDSNAVYRIQPVAGWIETREFDLEDATRHADTPYFYLLVDYQYRLRGDEMHKYRRTVQKINDASRLEDASLYLLEVKPDSQQLVIHTADVIRDGIRQSVLLPENIEVYRRETRLESHIVDHALTVAVSIDDLRVGDLLDIQVSLVCRAGAHPLHVRRYHGIFWLTWAVPVIRQLIRIVNRSDYALNLRHHRIEDDRPIDEDALLAPGHEFHREYRDLSPKTMPRDAPDWWWTDCLQVTPEQNWSQVSRYLYRYFEQAGILEPRIDPARIDRIELGGDSSADALRLVRFVQNEIRYRGEQHGIYTHTPKPAEAVLKKGAGDCKDKANLLRALLDAIGVEADLVLVNTDYGKGLRDLRPSANFFDHAIVRVRLGDELKYFDPTIRKQAGDFGHAAELDYGYVLPLTGDGSDLLELPYRRTQKTYILTHRFDLRDAASGRGRLVIECRLFAHRADGIRARFGATSAKQLHEDYLDYAENATGLDLEPDTPVAIVSDDTTANVLTLREAYRIVNLDSRSAENSIRLSTHFARDYPEARSERLPLQLHADGEAEHRITVRYPRDLDHRAHGVRIENPYFRYDDRVWAEGRLLCFANRVRPYTDVVPVDGLETYRRDYERMADRRINCFEIVRAESARPFSRLLSLAGRIVGIKG